MTRHRGLNGIALTDHDTMEGYFELAKIWPTNELQLIAGCERTLFDDTHVIGLFLDKTLTAITLRDVIKEIHDQGGLVYLPHPYREYSGVFGSAAKHSEEDRIWAVENADIIEIYNRKCTADENSRALVLANQYKKSFAGGSDAHRQHEIGFGCTVFRERLSKTNFETLEAYGLAEIEAQRETAHRNQTKMFNPRTAIRALLNGLGLLKPARTVRNHWRRKQQPTLVRYR